MAELNDDERNELEWLRIKTAMHDVALSHIFASFRVILPPDQKEVFLNGFEQRSHENLYLGAHPDEHTAVGQRRMNEFVAKNRQVTAQFLATVRDLLSPPKPQAK